MAVKFFGQFLAEHGIVTSDTLLAAIHLQDKHNLKLGETAVAMGLLTPADIVRAHNAQMSRDMKLGDLLVELGFITFEQLNDIIIRQKNGHLYIGEALVQLGALTSEISAYITVDTAWNSPTGLHDTALLVGPDGQEVGRRAKINITSYDCKN